MSSGKLSDECLAEKFRRENTEQFLILARMHLSFLLDLNTDESESSNEKVKQKKWPFGRKSKFKTVTEGVPLTQEGICQVYQLIEFIKKDQNITVEGIFRRTGSVERQQELKSLLSQGITLELEGSQFSVHDCASVLKGFLADLPDPLLTEGFFPACCQIAELCGIGEGPTVQDGKLLEALQLIFLLLPIENQSFLKDILDLLHLTSTFEENNKMSPDNLAKIFTPHLLCPRKLPPSELLTISQKYFGLITFMIKKSSELFKIPRKLKVDFQARYERKKLMASQNRILNESVTDTANTVFTFVDHERTAKENESNPTETALAQLYAHIQSLPESSKKRKLVSKFNKENGHGTPLQVARGSAAKKSFGDSIKKHIFQKGLAKQAKKGGYAHLRSSSEEILNSPQSTVLARARLFCANCDSSTDSSASDEAALKKLKTSSGKRDGLPDEGATAVRDARSKSESDLDFDEQFTGKYLTSTPACLSLRACPDLLFTPEEQGRKSMSPITRSTQRMTRAMQETMMTPRSRKPVLLLSGTNINALPKSDRRDLQMDNVLEEISYEDSSRSSDTTLATPSSAKCIKKSRSDGDIISDDVAAGAKRSATRTPSGLTDTFKEYLSGRDILASSPALADESFSSRTDDFNSADFQDLSDNKLSDSLLFCLNGYKPDESGEKELVLKPKQFDENGKAIVFETSF
ncbi:unnamed protein product [Brassicogethes aeneus]|uniref:Rho-GAP domain-containing protein n=1 Tax=Brassicogethes aeneus TaxID=1431903 RepID=A0A9P0FH62_BRAAE|nr:unnamed protein product [Brassicogethes aeneus]